MPRKLIVTLVLLLFLLPFVSWYYLQQGLNWRKDAQSIMNGKIPFPEGTWRDVKGKSWSTDILENKVTLITIQPCTSGQADSTLTLFYNQFKETQKANFIMIDSCLNPVVQIDSLRSNWYVFQCSDSISLCNDILKTWPSGKTHALIDKRKIIRSYYASGTEDEKRILLEHMALLLPRDRSEKVELKRGNNK